MDLMPGRSTTFTLTLLPNAAQKSMLVKHGGAARFAYNWGLAEVKTALEAGAARATPARGKVPWTGFDLINAFNRWKLSEAAGCVDGKIGLPWRTEVCAQAFEEALIDLGRGLKAFSDSKRGKRRGRKASFPVFKKKGRCRDSFRLRNKSRSTTHAIRLGDEGPRSLTLPKLGCLSVRQCTRRLRRMLNKGRCRILFATVYCSRGKWHVRLNCEAAAFVAPVGPSAAEPVGIDRGLRTFAVVADSRGDVVQTLNSPQPLKRNLRSLRRACRRLSRKQKGSRNRRKSAADLANLHGRIRDLRHDFLHRVSTDLVKNHDSLVLEDLNTAGMVRNRSLARSIADNGWAIFAKDLTYKAAWWGRTITLADRFYPSTKRCSRCGHVVPAMPLSQREFVCPMCEFRADRDVNAACNLAVWPKIVAGKRPETENACGGRSAGADGLRPSRETAPIEAGRGKPRRPRRAVLTEIVNTL
jgi:putative transposase